MTPSRSRAGRARSGSWSSTKRFPVLLHPGLALTQLRLFNGQSFLDRLEIDMAVSKPASCSMGNKKKSKSRSGMPTPSSCRSMWAIRWDTNAAARTSRSISAIGKMIRKTSSTRSRNVMAPQHIQERSLLYPLDLRTRDGPAASFGGAARDRPAIGEFRVHSAGYIDPGWGWGSDGSACGRPDHARGDTTRRFASGIGKTSLAYASNI